MSGSNIRAAAQSYNSSMSRKPKVISTPHPIPAKPKRNSPPFPFVLEALTPLEPEIRRMFGAHTVYLNDKVVLWLRDNSKAQQDNFGCHPRRGPASSVAVALALAFLSVIPEGNLLFASTHRNAGASYLQASSVWRCGTNKPQGVAAVVFLVVIPEGDLLLLLLLPLPLLFCLSFLKGTCCSPQPTTTRVPHIYRRLLSGDVGPTNPREPLPFPLPTSPKP
jgi:hypothetical protein